MNTTKTSAKAAYSTPRLTVHGNVEELTQTFILCRKHRRFRCQPCTKPVCS